MFTKGHLQNRTTAFFDRSQAEPQREITAGSRLKLVLVSPIFNDAVSFTQLCREIDLLLADWCADLSIVGVDDGSLQPAETLCFDPPLIHISKVCLVKLRSNVGHQRAIAIGLVEATQVASLDAVVVADCDGEDRPIDMGRLISAHRTWRDAVVVARRSKRSEGLRFRAFYWLYKAMFHAFTGKRIDFGNFVLLPRPALNRIVSMPDAWNHLAACILRSRLPLQAVGCHRGTRYAGASSMNLISLLIHGLSAVSVFSDFVFARMLIASAAIAVPAIITAATAIIIRLTTDLAIPGWATSVVGISMIIVLQALLFSMVAALTMLRDRSAVAFVPSAHSEIYVGERVTVFDASAPLRGPNDPV